MREAEQLIRPLEEVFNRITAQNLKNAGVKGVIQIELPIKALMASAESKGYFTDGVPDPREKDVRMYWVDPLGNPLIFYTRIGPDGEEVYILDQDLERFKFIFMET